MLSSPALIIRPQSDVRRQYRRVRHGRVKEAKAIKASSGSAAPTLWSPRRRTTGPRHFLQISVPLGVIQRFPITLVLWQICVRTGAAVPYGRRTRLLGDR